MPQAPQHELGLENESPENESPENEILDDETTEDEILEGETPEDEESKPTCFQDLPVEIQTAIFQEALQKPSVHWLAVVKQNYTQTWGVKISPLPKKNDPSGYRYLNGLKRVCKSAYAAVRLATLESFSIRFSMLPNTADAMTDLFVLEFRRSTRVGTGNNIDYIDSCYWHPMNTVVNPRCDVLSMRQRFRDMRKVAITYKPTHSHSHPGPGVPFRCLWIHPQTQTCLPTFRVCPVELAGFIDCLPDLETLYIIVVVSGRNFFHQAAVHRYKQHLFGMSCPLCPHPLGRHDSRITY